MKRQLTSRDLTALGVLVLVLFIVQAVIGILAVSMRQPGPVITGKATAGAGTVTFQFMPNYVCQIPLSQGWSLISLCADTPDSNITTLLAGIDYRYVMRWDDDTQEFDIYSPRAASNPFTTLEFNTSYFVNLNSASANLGLTGTNISDLNITLVPGWNGPGYPYRFTTTITRYFNGTKHRYLMKWDNPSQAFIIYSPRAASPAFDTISMPEGQLVNSYVDDVLRYNVSLLLS